MKKGLTLFLSFILCFLFCSCDKNKTTNTVHSSKDPLPRTIVYDDHYEEEQFFDLEKPILLMDNDVATVEIIKFFQEGYYPNKEVPDKGVIYKVKNKSKCDLSFGLDDVYVGDEKGDFSWTSNNSLAPGKTGEMKFYIRYVKNDEEPLESIETLHKLNGTFYVQTESKIDSRSSVVLQDYPGDFSLAEHFN